MRIAWGEILPSESLRATEQPEDSGEFCFTSGTIRSSACAYAGPTNNATSYPHIMDSASVLSWASGTVPWAEPLSVVQSNSPPENANQNRLLLVSHRGDAGPERYAQEWSSCAGPGQLQNLLRPRSAASIQQRIMNR